MRNCRPEFAITGLGVTSAIGQGKGRFAAALFEGSHAFGIMQRPGRQKGTAFLGAEIGSLDWPVGLTRKGLRGSSYSAEVAAVTVHEAWADAGLDSVDPARIGLIVGGSNFQQREAVQTQEAYSGRLAVLRPTYGLSFLDTDVCGVCTDLFGIRGLAFTVGGASASGQLAIIQAAQAIRSEQVDVCIAVGALMDLSYWECQAFRSLGAMGSDRYARAPELACRPFDASRDGFVFGECCGAVVVERASQTAGRNALPYAFLSGWATVMDGHRNPDPSFEGEVEAIRGALRSAQVDPSAIDYVNPHGTGSELGDAIEAKAIDACGLSHAWINATKSIVGHGLSAAGTVEVIATLIQMEASRVHPTRNLEDPIHPHFRWVRHEAERHEIGKALTISLGFGGINTVMCLEKGR